jgi:hypothetical protein
MAPGEAKLEGAAALKDPFRVDFYRVGAHCFVGFDRGPGAFDRGRARLTGAGHA